jgi:hypothetical protein
VPFDVSSPGRTRFAPPIRGYRSRQSAVRGQRETIEDQVACALASVAVVVENPDDERTRSTAAMEPPG